jgi:hypothetical protein
MPFFNIRCGLWRTLSYIRTKRKDVAIAMNTCERGVMAPRVHHPFVFSDD